MAGDLVIIDNLEENTLVKSKLPSPASISYFHGLTKSSGSWRWMDGSTASYTDWAGAQPDNTGGCGVFWDLSSYTWDDQWCNNNNKYVCEISGKLELTFADESF